MSRRQSKKAEKHVSLKKMTHSNLQKRPFTTGETTPSDTLANSRLNLRRFSLQPKLTIGEPNDPYEQEADRVATQVVQKINGPQKTDQGEKEIQRSPIQLLMRSPLQRHSSIPVGQASQEFESSLNHARGGGNALESGIKDKMEGAMQADFSGVKIHTGSQANQLSESIQAKAFTTGRDVFFKQGEYNPNSRDGQTLLAHELTHVVQQTGTAVQRHPSHAEEEEVQAKLDIQRHPSHAEEEEVQAKFIDNANQNSLVTAHESSAVVMRDVYIQRKKSKKEREQDLTDKYGVQIGGGPDAPGLHHSVLDKIDKVLAKIPSEHLTGTHLTNIGGSSGDDELGDASLYCQDSDTAGHIEIVVPDGVPKWLYPLLSKGVKWQRKIMDKGAIKSLAPNINKQDDKALGLKNSDRQVFAGVSNVLSKGNLLDWTIRHELGHAVDHKIKFTQKYAKKPAFGGWKQYKVTDENKFNEIAHQFLEKADIDLSALNQQNRQALTEDMRYQLSNNLNMRDRTVNNCKAEVDGIEHKIEAAVRLAKIARSQPWMFSDGGASNIAMNDGRIYHLDHYGTWVSYLRSARQNALSNYQFSCPSEWFAEAYAAFYDLKPNSSARDRLNNETVAFFTQNLGLPPQLQEDDDDQNATPGLANDDGILQELQDIAQDVANMDNQLEE